MARYEAMWADDGWSRSGDAEEHAFLSSCLQAVSGALDDADCRVEWQRYGSAAGAAVEAGSTGHDFRLAIVDFHFGGEEWNWRSVVDALASRSIPYIMFTNFPADAELTERLRNDPLRLATLPKDSTGLGALVAQVVDFFRAPPIRILHLTDLHVRADPGTDDHGEQEARFRALYDCLKAESTTRPLDLVAFTGDFGGHDPPRDLAAAQQKIWTLAETAVLGEAERVLVIPGNHDLHWADFGRKELAADPWGPYLAFYRGCFGGRHRLLEELSAWSEDLREMRRSAAGEALMWHRRLAGMRLSVLGLATPSLRPDRQGQGEFTGEHARFVQRHWAAEPAPGEVRLALMHHNLFSVLSASPHEEQHILHGAGLALQTLVTAHCHLVLSGHTHAPMVMQSSAARLRLAEWSGQGTVTAVSAGTVGGVHPALDRARAFNVLEIGHGRMGEPRSLTVRTFVFDGGDGRWVEVRQPFAGLTLRS